MSTGVGDPLVSWHEAAVDPLYTDADQTQLFTGIVRPGDGQAVAPDGTIDSVHVGLTTVAELEEQVAAVAGAPAPG